MCQGADGRIHATWSYAHEISGDAGAGNTMLHVTDIQYTSFTEEWVKARAFFTSPWEKK